MLHKHRTSAPYIHAVEVGTTRGVLAIYASKQIGAIHLQQC